MKKCNFLIAMLLCFLCVSCVERYVKQAVPAQGHGKVKLENVKDGKYSQAMISQIIEHFHLPANTVVSDEDADAILFKSVHGKDSVFSDDVVAIWRYYKRQGDIQEIVTSHPLADLTWYTPNKNHGIAMGIDSVFAINDAKLFPFVDSLIIVNGTIDALSPVYSFIVNPNGEKVILLPSNRGCIGFTSEEGLPICLSFRQHADEEFYKFSIVSVYDLDGKLVKEMSFEGYEE